MLLFTILLIIGLSVQVRLCRSFHPSNVLSTTAMSNEEKKSFLAFVDEELRGSSSSSADTDTMCSALLKAAEIYMINSQYEEALVRIDEAQRRYSFKYPFAIERTRSSDEEETAEAKVLLPDFEWIKGASSTVSENVALRTTGDIPILDPDTIQMIRQSAREHWDDAGDENTSRFSMQYEGNSEVHLHDLCTKNKDLSYAIDKALTEKVYPLVRSAFKSKEGGVPNAPLCVYDSIVVRYDGDKAVSSGRLGASQPLHLDGGLFSVNICLNSRDGGEKEGGFVGGGTFFERLVENEHGNDSVQCPVSPGHAVAHRSTERHAGAPTISGIREILVIFLTARQTESASGIERAHRLKTIVNECTRQVRIDCLKIATEQNPTDGEAYMWLGFFLLNGDNMDLSEERWSEINSGIMHLENAALLCPRDARVQYYLGMGLDSRINRIQHTGRFDLINNDMQKEMEKVIKALDNFVSYETMCIKAGCKNENIQVAPALLTLGKRCAQLGQLNEAIKYLENIEVEAKKHPSDQMHQAVLYEANSVMQYCRDKLQ